MEENERAQFFDGTDANGKPKLDRQTNMTARFLSFFKERHEKKLAELMGLKNPWATMSVKSNFPPVFWADLRTSALQTDKLHSNQETGSDKKFKIPRWLFYPKHKMSNDARHEFRIRMTKLRKRGPSLLLTKNSQFVGGTKGESILEAINARYFLTYSHSPVPSFKIPIQIRKLWHGR